MRRLRIGIDGRAFASPAAGVRRYVAGLARGLLELGRPLDIVALGGPPYRLPPGVEHVTEPLHLPTNAGWTLIGLPRAAARAAVDLIHAPAYTAPFWAPVPVVLTVHDVSYERHPQWYPYRRDRVRRAFYRLSARAASSLITVSSFSASELAATYDLPRDRITVTPLGVDAAFHPVQPGEQGSLQPGVTEPFLLHVGDLHERRNLAVALEAVLAVRRRVPAYRDLTLVLAGLDRGLGRALYAVAVAAGTPEAVLVLGKVDEEPLRQLYQRATALVYPSRYEGFGLPVLEAMACGTPVVASSAASMPEVLGDAGVLVDPMDGPAWADTLTRLLENEQARARMRASGIERAAEFTWERTARLTLEVYDRTVAQRT